MLLRRVHAYLAIFAAPSILFFALTGALQLFSLHEVHDEYTPPALIRGLASLHKNQMFDDVVKPASPKDATDLMGSAGNKASSIDRPGPAAASIMKWFFLFVTTALCASTGIGLWLGLRAIRQKRVRWFLLSCGAAIPTILAIFTRSF